MATKKKTIPKGYHRMPDGKLMKDSAHKAAPRKRVSKTRKNNMDY